MIPKIIHYCWFGKKPKGTLIENCIKSWRTTCPEFTIQEWNEENFDINAHPFTKRMYEEKKFAFVADYARLITLENEGGVYLDTDMELVQNITPLLDHDLVLGEEDPGIISAGMIASAPHNAYIAACKKEYDHILALPKTIPLLMTEVFNNMKETMRDVRVCAPITFYPYSAQTISKYKKEDLTSETYGVHLWNYSWGPMPLRILNKMPLYRTGVRLLDRIGLKKTIKKIIRLS